VVNINLRTFRSLVFSFFKQQYTLSL